MYINFAYDNQKPFIFIYYIYYQSSLCLHAKVLCVNVIRNIVRVEMNDKATFIVIPFIHLNRNARNDFKMSTLQLKPLNEEIRVGTRSSYIKWLKRKALNLNRYFD